MTVASALLGFAVVAGLLTITPGLDTALVLRAAVTQGRTTAYATGAGICAGCLAWGMAAAVGVSAVLTASTVAYDGVRLAGAAYMIWLGVRLLRSVRNGHEGRAEDAVPATAAPLRAFQRGLLTNALNPKVGAFYVAVLPQFLPEDVSALLMGTALAMVHVALGLLWFTLLILASARMRRFLDRPSAQRGLDAGTGIVLIGFGLRLGLER